MKKFTTKIILAKENLKKRFRDKSGQGAVDTAIIVLLSVVLGALLLAGLYALMDDTVLPTLTQKIQEMFNVVIVISGEQIIYVVPFRSNLVQCIVIFKLIYHCAGLVAFAFVFFFEYIAVLFCI